ncbi:PAS domain-containing protein [Algimonas arctica]|uniref:PAS domain-containing protein n=1 Tax=Algimonas arctica TaxID=1479486 RepID=UPI001F1B0ADD|nr:PAS domain-containing protein [Algimonas arctica]
MSERRFGAPSSVTVAAPNNFHETEWSELLSLKDTPALNQITALICEIFDVPLSFVSVIAGDRHVYLSAKGLAKPLDALGQVPLNHSFSQHVVTSNRLLQVNDARQSTLGADDLAIGGREVKAYLGTPVRDSDGFVLGCLCAIDSKPRKWAARDIKVLEGFSAAITTQLQRERAVNALSQSHGQLAVQETRLKRITNMAPVMIAALSTDLFYTFANKSYAALFDETPETILGLHLREVLGEEAILLADPYLQKALAGQSTEYDFELPRSDGSSRIFRIHHAPELNPDNKTQGLVVALTDVTDQRLLSSLASRLEDRLKAAYQMSPDGFSVFKSQRNQKNEIVDFEWEYVNERGTEITGHSAANLIGNTLLTMMPGNKTQGIFDAYVDVVNTGLPYRETAFYEADGLSLWVEISAIKLGDGFAVSYSDVTARKQTEIALAENAVRLQLILDNVVAFVGVLTPEGILKKANQPALDIAGVSRADVIGKPFWETHWWNFSDESKTRLKQAIADANDGIRSRYDTQVQIHNGEKIWIDFQLSPRFDSHGTLVEIIPSGMDITERKEAEAHRQLLVDELNHRVKNSLASIQAMARQTIRTAKDLHSFETKFTDRLKAISTAHEILMGSDNAKADLRTMIDRQVGPYIEDKRHLKITGDKAMLAAECAHNIGLVFHELATNAAKYGALSSDRGCVKISSEDLGDGTVKIVWSETGGPPVSAPSATGFGSRLIKQSIEFSLGGSVDVDYRAEGVVATVILPKDFDHG